MLRTSRKEHYMKPDPHTTVHFPHENTTIRLCSQPINTSDLNINPMFNFVAKSVSTLTFFIKQGNANLNVYNRYVLVFIFKSNNVKSNIYLIQWFVHVRLDCRYLLTIGIILRLRLYMSFGKQKYLHACLTNINIDSL